MILKILVETYIAYRRSLGEKFVTNARELQMFVNYAGLKCDVCTIDRSLCESFLLHPKGYRQLVLQAHGSERLLSVGGRQGTHHKEPLAGRTSAPSGTYPPLRLLR